MKSERNQSYQKNPLEQRQTDWPETALEIKGSLGDQGSLEAGT